MEHFVPHLTSTHLNLLFQPSKTLHSSDRISDLFFFVQRSSAAHVSIVLYSLRTHSSTIMDVLFHGLADFAGWLAMPDVMARSAQALICTEDH